MTGKKQTRQISSARFAISACFLIVVLTIQSFAGTSVKTFDFGAGGDNPASRSHSRSFLAPQSVAVAVRVNYAAAGDVPIPVIVEVEDAASRVAASHEVVAGKAPKRLIINIAAGENAASGCEKGWQVRVKSRDGHVPAARVFGDITFSFIDSPATAIAVEARSLDLKKGVQASLPLGGAETFRHSGVVNIRASWTHNPLARALPLKFELVRPDKSVAKSLIGYGTNSNARPKLDFDYRVVAADTKQNGVWFLRITNDAEQEIYEINPSATFAPRCFE